MSKGDILARGGKSAVFPPAQVSQAKWDSIFAPELPVSDACEVLENLLKGRNVAGVHISYESSQLLRQDPRFKKLTGAQIKLLNNLTDPPKKLMPRGSIKTTIWSK